MRRRGSRAGECRDPGRRPDRASAREQGLDAREAPERRTRSPAAGHRNEDQVIPLSEGGATTRDNLWRLCPGTTTRRPTGSGESPAPPTSGTSNHPHHPATTRPDERNARAEGVGFEPTVSCPTHAFQACRFGRSRIPPEPIDPGSRAGRRVRTGDGRRYPRPADRARRGARGALYPQSTSRGAELLLEARTAARSVPLSVLRVGSCATGPREPSQVRKEAALSGPNRVPQASLA